MKAICLNGSFVGHRNCECRVGAEGVVEREEGEVGVEELHFQVRVAKQPLVLEKQAAATAAAGAGGGGELMNSALR